MCAAPEEKKYINFVHNDQIWRNNIIHEIHTANVWDRNWGFLKGFSKQKPLLNKRRHRHHRKSSGKKLPQIQPNASEEDKQKDQENQEADGDLSRINSRTVLPPIKAASSSSSSVSASTSSIDSSISTVERLVSHFPCSTSREIGWGVDNLKMPDTFGPYTEPMRKIRCWLGFDYANMD
eukprot:Nk52_evm6s246 gene=Nk52_evmTU6s246